MALQFLILWPSLDHAAKLVRARAGAIDGDYYELLSPAADTLDARDPLAATLLRRAMIDFTLQAARSKRYRHAARHLQECKNLADRIAPFAPHIDHATYVNQLRRDHSKKSAFWDKVGGK
nr:DUF6880 family protein [uncultured Ruegeria sp.]